MKKRVLTLDTGDGLFCLGIFDSPDEAISHMMMDIWEFQENYREERDEFLINPLIIRNDGGGAILEVRFKASCWDHFEKHTYHILNYENEED